MSQQQWGTPEDDTPIRQRSQPGPGPVYGQPYPPPYYSRQAQPIVVNNIINNVTGGGLVVHKRIRHGLHITLCFLTSGLWLLVYIPMLKRRRRYVVVR